MLQLLAPVPVNTIAFERIFTGDLDVLVHLSKLRQELHNLVMSGGNKNDQLRASKEYYYAWRDFAKHISSSTKTRQFLYFTWTHKLFGSMAVTTDSDPSLVFESVCAGLAAACNCYNFELFEEAHEICREIVIVAQSFVPRAVNAPMRRQFEDFSNAITRSDERILREIVQHTRREPLVLAPSLLQGLDYFFHSHQLSQFAKNELRNKSRQQITEYLFTAQQLCNQAISCIPYIRELRGDLARIGASAYRCLSDIAKAHIGISIACMNTSVAYAKLVGTEETFIRHFESLVNENTTCHESVPREISIVEGQISSVVEFEVSDDNLRVRIVGLKIPHYII